MRSHYAWLSDSARFFLVAALSVTAALKLWGTPPGSLLDPLAARTAAGLELILVGGLVFQRQALWPFVGALSVAIFGAAIVYASAAPCGCAGPIEMSGTDHFMLCMTLGFMACVALVFRSDAARRVGRPPA